MRADLEAFGAPHVLVSSADHVFSMDLAPVVDEHMASGRVATLLTTEVTKKEASDNVVVRDRARRPGHRRAGQAVAPGVRHRSRPRSSSTAPMP